MKLFLAVAVALASSAPAGYWFRPDQPRDNVLDAPERCPRIPHERIVGAWPYRDEAVRQRELAQWLSPPDDPIGYRGLCVLHHSGPHCRGDNTPLPPWVVDSPDEPWTRSLPRTGGTWRTPPWRSAPPASRDPDRP